MTSFIITNNWDDCTMTTAGEWVNDGRESAQFASREIAQQHVDSSPDAERLKIEEVTFEDEE